MVTSVYTLDIECNSQTFFACNTQLQLWLTSEKNILYSLFHSTILIYKHLQKPLYKHNLVLYSWHNLSGFLVTILIWEDSPFRSCMLQFRTFFLFWHNISFLERCNNHNILQGVKVRSYGQSCTFSKYIVFLHRCYSICLLANI